MKGIYLASYKAYHPGYNIVYQDINGKRDIAGDMLNIDLDEYDYIIATPPCNYWSRANYRRETSEYSQKTKHLLPEILARLQNSKKPYVIENVINKKLMREHNLFDKAKYVYFIGRHTYWSNIYLTCEEVEDLTEKQTLQNVENLARTKRQGDDNVHIVIDKFLEIITECKDER